MKVDQMQKILLAFGGCTVLSIISDTLTRKLIMEKFSFPIFVSLVQFLMGSVLSTVLSVSYGFLTETKKKRFKFTDQMFGWMSYDKEIKGKKILYLIYPIAVFHMVGFVATNFSISSVNLSFAHTIKASECIFTALFSLWVLRQKYHIVVYLSLIPIVFGVGMSSVGELTFSWLGLITALISNICFAMRSTLTSTRLKEKLISDIEIYRYMSFYAFVSLLPAFLFLELRSFLLAFEFDFHLIFLLILCGAAHYLYNQLSIILLHWTSPLTHVVIHDTRRIIVIIYSFLLLSKTSPTWINLFGIILVFSGALSYSLARYYTNRSLSDKYHISRHKNVLYV